MAQHAKIILSYNPSSGFNTGTFQITLNGTQHTFNFDDSSIYSSDPHFKLYKNFATLLATVSYYATLGGTPPYQVTNNGINQITLTALDYGDSYNFGSVSANAQSGVTFSSQQDNVGTPLVASEAHTSPSVHNGNDGTITLTVSGANTPYTYAWQDGPATQNRTGLSVGSYTVVVSDTARDGVPARTQTLIIEIVQPPVAVEFSAAITNVKCHGSATGAIVITVSSGPEPLTYAWQDGPTTKDRSNLIAGSYTLTITATNAQTKSHTYQVTQNTAILVEATVVENDVTLVVSGGVAPYTYEWSDTEEVTTKDRQDLEPGSYTVFIIDSVGCAAHATVNISDFRFFFSRNPVTLPLQALAPETKPNLSFVCEIWIELVYKSENFTKVITLEQPAEFDGSTVFDAQAILDAYLKPYLPEGKETLVSRADSLFKRFYFRYTEKYGTPPVNASFTQVDTNYVLQGGLSFEEFAADTFFSSYLASRKPFFTWEPDEKEVFADQPEYLHFLPNSFLLTSFKCVVKLFYSDGSTGTHIFHTQANVLRFELYCIPAGYAQLGLGDYDPAKTVESWQLYITDPDGELISETRTYQLKTEFASSKRFFLYQNSLGCYNTLAATGKAKLSVDPDSQQIEKILQKGYTTSEGEVNVIRKTGKRTLSLSSGYISKEYLVALQDFIISESVLLVDGATYLAGPVKDKTLPVDDEEETLASLDFEFELPKMYNFTPRLA